MRWKKLDWKGYDIIGFVKKGLDTKGLYKKGLEKRGYWEWIGQLSMIWRMKEGNGQNDKRLDQMKNV